MKNNTKKKKSGDKVEKKKKLFSAETDDTMKDLFIHLLGDFRSHLGRESHRDHEIALKLGIPQFRQTPFPNRLQAPPYVFKMEAQLENLFKRYRFKNDMYTDEELSQRTFSKFMETQVHLCNHMWKTRSFRAHLVLQEARKIVKRILTGFDPEQAEELCRFSTRATKGNPARDSYLDHKLADPITGSPEHIKWFKCHLRSEGYLRSVIEQCSPTGEPIFDVCTSLDLVDVPKSYKSYRLISPNTLIGSYYTYGLGSVMVAALRQEGLDIRKLQSRHRKLAKIASQDRRLVTADMSSASESFLWSLIAALVPRKWLRALNRGRIRSYSKDGSTYHYASFMAMGIGFTFPLQTLLFYAICQACCALSNVKGTISVYGDDLIYPRRAHKFISTILTDLGMKLNFDKTFVESNFRESCGGDYHHGVDVRPFSPEGSSRRLGRSKYEAWLYQLINGLSERWSPEELPGTYQFLREEIIRSGSLIKRVPPSFPDDSGWRVGDPRDVTGDGVAPIIVRFQHGSAWFQLPHLTKMFRKRYVCFQQAYLYEHFRSRLNDETDETEPLMCDNRINWMAISLPKITDEPYEARRELLEWIKHPVQPKRYRSSTGKRMKKTVAVTTCNLTQPRYSTKTESISDWS